MQRGPDMEEVCLVVCTHCGTWDANYEGQEWPHSIAWWQGDGVVACAAAVVADAASQQWKVCDMRFRPSRPTNENMAAIEMCWICFVMYRLLGAALKHSIQTFVAS